MSYYVHINKHGHSRCNLIVEAEPMRLDIFSKYPYAKLLLKSTKESYFTEADIKASRGEGYFFESVKDDEIEGWLPKNIFEKEFSKLVIVPFDN